MAASVSCGSWGKCVCVRVRCWVDVRVYGCLCVVMCCLSVHVCIHCLGACRCVWRSTFPLCEGAVLGPNAQLLIGVCLQTDSDLTGKTHTHTHTRLVSFSENSHKECNIQGLHTDAVRFVCKRARSERQVSNHISALVITSPETVTDVALKLRDSRIYLLEHRAHVL